MKRLFLLTLSLLALAPQYALTIKTPKHTGFTKIKDRLYATFADGHPSEHDQINTYPICGRHVTVNWSHLVSIGGATGSAIGLGIESRKESDKRAGMIGIGSLATLGLFSLWKAASTGKWPITTTRINANQADASSNKSAS